MSAAILFLLNLLLLYIYLPGVPGVLVMGLLNGGITCCLVFMDFLTMFGLNEPIKFAD